jgi:ferredoxin
MNIDVSKAETVDSPECISCMECVSACPTKKGTLVPSLGGRALKAGKVVALGLGIYLGAAAVGQALGLLRFSAPSLGELSSKGLLKVEDIKGSSTYAAVAESFGVELERLYREAGVDPQKVPPETMLKDTGRLAGIEGFEADAVRVAVARILGLPYAGEDAGLPSADPAVAAPQAAASPAAAVPSAAPPASGAASTATGAESDRPAAALIVPADFALEGTMSVAEIAGALKADEAAVLAKLGLPAAFPLDRPLRDLKDEYGYTMADLKERIKR